MAWRGFWETLMAAVESTHKADRAVWDRVWDALQRNTTRYRGNVAARARRVNLGNARELQRFHNQASKLATIYADEAAGAASDRLFPGMSRNASKATRAMSAADRTLVEDLRTAADRAAENNPELARKFRTSADRVEKAARDGEAISARELEDLEEIGGLAEVWLAEDVRHESARATGITRTLSTKYSKRGSAADVVSFMVGHEDNRQLRADDEKTDTGFRLTRSTMEAATFLPLKTIVRRRYIAEALARGITHFRMDLPRAEIREGISPSSVMVPDIWRVRTMEEWQDRADIFNRDQLRSMSWETGFGFADRSRLIPVHEVYLEAATEHGERLRNRFLV